MFAFFIECILLCVLRFTLGGGGGGLGWGYNLDQSSGYNKAISHQVSFNHWSGQTYNNKIGGFFFAFPLNTQHYRTKTKDWLSRHQGELSSMSTCGLLFQRATTIKIQTIYCNEMFSNYLALVQR